MGRRANSKRIADSRTFVVDADYLRDQAKDAVRTFLAPLNGVYLAAVGTEKAEKPKKRG